MVDPRLVAMYAFQRTLGQFLPHARHRSFAGAAKAAFRAGDGAQAKSYYEKLLALAGNADTARPDLVAAKQYLAGK